MSKTTFTLKRKQYAIPGLGFGSAAFKQMAKTNSFGKNAALAGKGALGALGSTALVGGTLVAGGAALGKGVVSKASEQSDGSKVFSQVNNDNMATTYTLKRKMFSPNFSNMSTGKLEQIAAQTAGAGNTIVDGAKKELANRVPSVNVNTPTQKPKATNPSLMAKGKAYWNKMGTMGKVGVVGAGVVGAGLMAKGLFGGKKKDQ